jgi:hypothetical protein
MPAYPWGHWPSTSSPQSQAEAISYWPEAHGTPGVIPKAKPSLPRMLAFATSWHRSRPHATRWCGKHFVGNTPPMGEVVTTRLHRATTRKQASIGCAPQRRRVFYAAARPQPKRQRSGLSCRCTPSVRSLCGADIDETAVKHCG